MPRTVINRSISFDPQLFEKMEKRRTDLVMDRSEYVKRCIMRDMLAGGEMGIPNASGSLVKSPESDEKTLGRKRKK